LAREEKGREALQEKNTGTPGFHTSPPISIDMTILLFSKEKRCSYVNVSENG